MEQDYSILSICGARIQYFECLWSRNTVFRAYVEPEYSISSVSGAGIQYFECVWSRNTVFRMYLEPEFSFLNVCGAGIQHFERLWSRLPRLSSLSGPARGRAEIQTEYIICVLGRRSHADGGKCKEPGRAKKWEVAMRTDLY